MSAETTATDGTKPSVKLVGDKHVSTETTTSSSDSKMHVKVSGVFTILAFSFALNESELHTVSPMFKTIRKVYLRSRQRGGSVALFSTCQCLSSNWKIFDITTHAFSVHRRETRERRKCRS